MPPLMCRAFVPLALVSLIFATGCPRSKSEDSSRAAEAPPTGPKKRSAVDPVAEAWQRSLTSHRDESYVGTLEAIQKRGVLRVGMQNNGASYFIYRGQQAGFQLEMAELLAARIAVRLQVVVPPRPNDMVRLLREGKVDVIPVAQGDPSEEFIHTPPFIFADHVIVQGRGEPPLTDEKMLAGRRVHVRRSSRYRPFLLDIQKRVPSLAIVDADENLETQELIAGVAAGQIRLTVANTVLLRVELTQRDDVAGHLTIAKERGLVYAISKAAPALAARLRGIIERDVGGDNYERIYSKYFNNHERMAELRRDELRASGKISAFDDLAKRFGRANDVDWRLVLAQMYQESRFDPKAVSYAGARGLMQLMPATAEELGVSDIEDPEQNIEAGVRYLRTLIDRFDPKLAIRQRIRFALASYNAGFYHVKDARELATKQGLDPDRWFGHVEKTIQLLEHRRYYRNAEFGYCRGREPAQYVSRIQSRYEGFAELTDRP